MALNLVTIFLIFVILVTADKALTYANISLVKKNFPNVNPVSIERNPIAKFLFEKVGLLGGSIIYWIISIGITFLGFNIMKKFFGESVSLYLLFLLYGFVIFNNTYFLLKYARVIP